MAGAVNTAEGKVKNSVSIGIKLLPLAMCLRVDIHIFLVSDGGGNNL
jgi:hypothetical protein